MDGGRLLIILSLLTHYSGGEGSQKTYKCNAGAIQCTCGKCAEDCCRTGLSLDQLRQGVRLSFRASPGTCLSQTAVDQLVPFSEKMFNQRFQPKQASFFVYDVVLEQSIVSLSLIVTLDNGSHIPTRQPLGATYVVTALQPLLGAFLDFDGATWTLTSVERERQPPPVTPTKKRRPLNTHQAATAGVGSTAAGLAVIGFIAALTWKSIRNRRKASRSSLRDADSSQIYENRAATVLPSETNTIADASKDATMSSSTATFDDFPVISETRLYPIWTTMMSLFEPGTESNIWKVCSSPRAPRLSSLDNALVDQNTNYLWFVNDEAAAEERPNVTLIEHLLQLADLTQYENAGTAIEMFSTILSDDIDSRDDPSVAIDQV